MKKSISYLFIILLGIIAFLTSILTIYKYSTKAIDIRNKKETINSFIDLYNDIEDVCRSFIGEKRSKIIEISKNFSIYGKDNLICIEDIKNRDCKTTTCKINIFKISYNNSEFYRSIFGDSPQTYKVTIEKVSPDEININYELYIE